MVADQAAIVAGKPFLLGVLLTMDPGWHIYWKNPGDAGIATKVKFDLPSGFSAGELLYPTPMRIDQAGDIHCFGYEESVLLWEVVTPPATLPADVAKQFKADVSWLVCDKECYPGKAALDLTLQASSHSQPDNEDLFKQWEARLPTDAAGPIALADWRTVPDHDALEVSFQISWNSPEAPKEVQFFPELSQNYDIERIQVSGDGKKSQITFRLTLIAGKKAEVENLNTVVGYNLPEGRRGWNLKISFPNPFPAGGTFK